MPSENPRIELTPAKLGFFLALVAAGSFGWNLVSYFKALELKDYQQDRRIDAAEVADERFERSLARLTEKTDQLREAVVKLTVVIEGGPLARHTELNSETKK